MHSGHVDLKLPHPRTGALFASPVPPGAGWPGDVASPATPVATKSTQVVRLAAAAMSIEQLDAEISVCRACPRLVRWREDVAVGKRKSYADQPYWGRPIPGWGSPRPRVMVVGLAPAAHGGNRTGRVFTGDRSGDFLFAGLHRAGLANQALCVDAADGLALNDTRIAAAVRCAPPANAPTPEERITCAPWLDAEWRLTRASVRVIIALGGFGWRAALEMVRNGGATIGSPAPRFGHGVTADLGEVTLIGCFHPSQQNTFTGRLTAQMLDDVFVRAKALASDE
ncbi:uracil-DNA glycosylase [Mycobacterium gallinarum]|uniref:Type-5 uracil-DNA glycosylase n=1 Tax=Mycobacterium gallinarum TaxID=39689 RepID=A0A9W4B373_9MYCO|nr:uracil-DNA glycosylase [Mycobacterium gallinarum]BBY93139.1 uracil-DNA glycosylase [Mycobacterium gallinarum]